MSYIAERKNRIIHISEEKAEEYAKMGYKVSTEDGDIVAEPDATTTEGANAEIARLRDELAEKDAIITGLNSENAKLREKLDEATKEEKKPPTKRAAPKTQTAPAKE